MNLVMDTLALALSKAWTVLYVGLLFGAGLPVLFAFGVRALGMGGAGTSETGDVPPTVAGRVLGYLIFALIIAMVAVGIMVIVAGGFGKQVSFDHILPAIVDKKK